MRILIFFTFFISINSCFGQVEKYLIKQKPIDDLSEFPIYGYLIENKNGEQVWKEEFMYIDSIDIYIITYLSDGLKINGFLAKPKASGSYPCVIFNRGGNRDFGALTVASAVHTLGSLAKEGYVVIASQYRGNGGSEGVEEFGGQDVNDVLILPEVLKEVSGADPDNIGMFGWSRGGMMTYLALKQTDRIKAAVVGGAVSNAFESIQDRPVMETGVMAELIPDYKQNKEFELTKRSAVKWADQLSKDVPILVLHGNADWRVKVNQSYEMAIELDKHRIPYRLVVFEGGDHGLSDHSDEVNEQIVRWFNRFLKNKESLPNMEYHGR